MMRAAKQNRLPVVSRRGGTRRFILLSAAAAVSSLSHQAYALKIADVFFWNGDQDTNWNTETGGQTNWSLTPDGLTDTGSTANPLPDVHATVVFSASNVNANNPNNAATALMTTLGQDFDITLLDVNTASPLTISGSNNLFLEGGGINVNSTAGALTISTNTIILDQNQTWTNNSSSPFTISASIQGTTSLTLTGTGTTVLAGINTATGNTIVSSGTVQFASPDPASGNLEVDNSTVDVNGQFAAIGGLTGSGGTILSNNGFGYVDISTNTTAEYSGVIADGPGQVAIEISGGGTQVLAGVNTYTGGTTIDSSATLQLGDGTNNGNLAAGSTVDDEGNLVFDNATSENFGALIGGNGNVVVSGSAPLILSGANSYGGNTTINAGSTLESGNASSLGDTFVLDVEGTLDLGGVGAATFQLTGTTGTITNSVANSPATLLVQGGGSFAGNIIDGAGKTALEISSGTLALTGANTYSGGTTIDDLGTLQINAAGALPSGGSITDNGSLAINANSTAGQISGIGSVTIAPSVKLTLAANNSPSSVASLTLGAGSTLDITNNTLTINYGSGLDPAATIRADLISGFNASGAKWTGTGITSSMAAANPNRFAIGYADGGNPADAANANLAAGELEIKYTVAGDANLSGNVDLSDLVIIASDFGMHGADWAQGDVNYDGNVDLSDLVIIASNFGASLGSVSGADFSSSFVAEWQLAQAQAHSADVSVPEPASLTCMAIAGLLSLRRRNRASCD